MDLEGHFHPLMSCQSCRSERKPAWLQTHTDEESDFIYALLIPKESLESPTQDYNKINKVLAHKTL